MKNTQNHIVYGEVGVMPLNIDIYTRMISYWVKLKEGSAENSTLTLMIYNITNSYYKKCEITKHSKYFRWIHCIKTILNNCGFSGIWDTQNIIKQANKS